MNNPFPYSLDNKRYLTWNYYLQKTYGCKVAKVPLDARFTCPNRDGTKGFGGCTFCSAQGSGDFPTGYTEDLMEQFSARYEVMKHKWPDCKAIVYFQAYTNTYAPLKTLKKIYEPFLSVKDVVAISIATRADCLSDEVIGYLDWLGTKTDIWVELGVQSVHEKTAVLTNRGHSHEETVRVIEKLKNTSVHVCVHVINGFPWETREMMTETVRQLAKLPVDAMKIHMLHILKDSAMGRQYEKEPFALLTREEYVSLVVDQLELLPETMILQRLTGDGMADDLLAPMWTKKKTIVLNEIDKEMVRRNTVQGRRYEP
ncbi:MAG: TIGR01212 family radical SAM protein [Erysipelotrichaceae bacterium]|nr:TIGR01212 family radical SAM protein [Erysipelotrichaceae bacterium]